MNKQNYAVIDFMRCILIQMVILIHIVHFGTLYPDIKNGILSFLMPSFLFITGYLVNINKPLKAFAVYIVRILLPYLIMAGGYMVMSLYLPVRDGISVLDVPTALHVLFVTSIGPYWFLHAMMVCGICYYAAWHLFPKLSETAKFCLLASLLLTVAMYTPVLNVKCAVYYFLGAGARLFIKDFNRLCPKTFWPAIPFALILMQKIWIDWWNISVLGCVACFLAVSSALYEHTGNRLRKAMLYIGRNTLPIFIFHPIFTMTAKFLVPVFSFDHTGIAHTVFTIAICLAGSIGIGLLFDVTRLSYIFGKRRIMR